MSQQDERAAFEACMAAEGHKPHSFERLIGGSYKWATMQDRWLGWQARASLPGPADSKDDGAVSVSGNGGPPSLSVRAEVADQKTRAQRMREANERIRKSPFWDPNLCILIDEAADALLRRAGGGEAERFAKLCESQRIGSKFDRYYQHCADLIRANAHPHVEPQQPGWAEVCDWRPAVNAVHFYTPQCGWAELITDCGQRICNCGRLVRLNPLPEPPKEPTR